VWSLGVVLFEALSGSLPHQAPNYNAMMVRILSHDPDSIRSRRPDLPDKVCEIVDGCLQRDRDRRPAAGQLASMMEQATRLLRADRFRRSGGRRLDDQPPTGEPASLNDTAAARRKLILISASTGMVGALVGLLVGYLLAR
jgi:serine/threonine-protein kinase